MALIMVSILGTFILIGLQMPCNLHEGAAALIVSLVLFIGVSKKLSTPQAIDPDIEAVMDL